MRRITPTKIIVALLGIVIVLGFLYLLTSFGTKPDNVNVKQLPMSLAKWYPPENSGPEYLSRMWKLGGSMMGIIINTLEGDMDNASVSFEQFSMNYKESSDMVPEWSGYYNKHALNELEAAVNSEDPDAIMMAISEIGESCASCHKDQKPYVWAEYRMQDFRTITINTPEGPIPFPEGKMKYLAGGFDGTIVNALEGQQDATSESFGLFKMMFYNMKETCGDCHQDSPRYYYVSTDVTDTINDTELQIAAGNFGTVLSNMEQIGNECYKCHVVHESLQRIKEQMESNE